MTILAIESSCDETSASVIKNGVVLSNVVSTQLIHEKYGGVVPELASRAHQQLIQPVVNKALADAGIHKLELNAIGFTRGPGLLGALIVGTSFAKSFALGLNIPLIEVNHMQAHVLAHFIEDPKPIFPFLCLTVSGGHTQIVLVKSHLDMKVIGETIDDAVGEAFDKIAKMLKLPYPGGPNVDKLAQNGDANRFKFPISEMKEYDFSFSGIKTSVLYFIQKQQKENPNFVQENIEDICASVQKTLIETLIIKLKKAAKSLQIKQLAIAGGVSANSGLRKKMQELATENDCEIFLPRFEFCTDNAAMIAITAHYKALAGQFSSQEVSPLPRIEI